MGMTTDNAPLENRESTGQLIARINRELDRIQRDIHELGARMDSAFVGADYHKHYTEHIEIAEQKMERRRLWSNLRSQAMAGVMMAIGGGLIGLIAFAFAQYVKHGTT